MREVTVLAKVENSTVIQEFAEEILDEAMCPFKVATQVCIAIDELFANVCMYAYPDREDGDITVGINIIEDPKSVELTFTDSGMPYDPLSKEDPDVFLSLEERKIGGLGIFMVKNMMDDMTYEYKDGHNVVSIKKLF